MKSKSMVEWSSSEVPARRSSRNCGLQRRAWDYLLRANPDEHDPTRPGQTSASSSPSTWGQKSKLLKSSSAKSSSDSLKSNVSSTSHKALLSQPVNDSLKALAVDRKRAQKNLSANLDHLLKKPRHSASVFQSAKNNSVSATATSVPSHSAVTYKFTENGLVHSKDESVPDVSFLSYR